MEEFFSVKFGQRREIMFSCLAIIVIDLVLLLYLGKIGQVLLKCQIFNF